MPPLKIQYCSDLHLEFAENKEFFKQHPLKVKGDVLILAGDIVPFVILEREKDFFNFCSEHFQKTFWIPGNHEYYSDDISLRSASFVENIRENVFLVNNAVLEHEDVRFVCTTLWSHIQTKNSWYLQKRFNDFHVIKNKFGRFSPNQFNALHEEALKFLSSTFAKPSALKTIVATHHVPTFLNYPEQYKGDALNDAFASEQYSNIEKWQPDVWIYGHHHQNTPAFQIGKTQLINNQLGYVEYGEHEGFNPDACFEI